MSDEIDALLKAAMDDLNALAIKHDARALAVACISKGAYLYQQLRQMGYETPESLVEIFQFGCDRACEDGEPARVLVEGGHITTTSRN